MISGERDRVIGTIVDASILYNSNNCINNEKQQKTNEELSFIVTIPRRKQGVFSFGK